MRKCLCVSIIMGLLLLVLSACGDASTSTSTTSQAGASSAGGSSTSSPTAASTTTGAVPLQITNVSVSINPATLVRVVCGSTANITFTATLYANIGSSGGQVAYTWTINGTNTTGTITFGASDTSKTIAYTLSGVSIQYNAVNIPVTFTVNSPNQITSSPAKVAGNCTFPNAFVITGVSVVVKPASITGMACNTKVTFVYTATVTIGANSNGGTALLTWHLPGFTRPAHAIFAPGTTTQSILYPVVVHLSKTASLPGASITSNSPNVVASNIAVATGVCM